MFFCHVEALVIGEVGKMNQLWLRYFQVIFLPKTVKLEQCLLKLQLKMSKCCFRDTLCRVFYLVELKKSDKWSETSTFIQRHVANTYPTQKDSSQLCEHVVCVHCLCCIVWTHKTPSVLFAAIWYYSVIVNIFSSCRLFFFLFFFLLFILA